MFVEVSIQSKQKPQRKAATFPRGKQYKAGAMHTTRQSYHGSGRKEIG